MLIFAVSVSSLDADTADARAFRDTRSALENIFCNIGFTQWGPHSRRHLRQHLRMLTGELCRGERLPCSDPS